MTLIKRDMEAELISMAKSFPVIVLTGPRQSGKTTLAKMTFPEKAYVSLEDLDHRQEAALDPRGFLARYPEGAIIDEAQLVPQLFSYIQTLVDSRKRKGDFILTGWQNFLLLEKVTQSLAGRVAILHLLPLTYAESKQSSLACTQMPELLFRGLYPGLYEDTMNPQAGAANYIRTYIERDVRQVKNILDLAQFRLFVQLCAGRIGQLLNMESLSADCGIDVKTAKSWLSLLETSYIIHILRPHHKNFNKRLVKQPKLYFYDTSLAAYLLGIQSAAQLSSHASRGALFESFVVTELIKHAFNQGKEHNLYFWRDSHGHEVDILIDLAGQLTPIEVKSASTVNSSFFDSLNYFNALSPGPNYLVYSGEASYPRTGGQVLGFRDMKQLASLLGLA